MQHAGAWGCTGCSLSHAQLPCAFFPCSAGIQYVAPVYEFPEEKWDAVSCYLCGCHRYLLLPRMP
jgi:hypothetical protein